MKPKYTIKCPNCGRKMIIQTDNPDKARKKCVFCGNAFPIKSTIIMGGNECQQ